MKEDEEEDFEYICIVSEKPEHIPAIHRVNELAFGRSAEADLVDALRANGKAVLSLVAECDNEVVGHILFSPVTIESEKGTFRALGLAPMAVLPEHQNLGIGSELVENALDVIRESEDEIAVVVLGHPEYYPRFGFVPASRFGLRSEYDVPDEAFMALETRPGSLNGVSGTVRYAPEFAAV